jgi:hypothetical protein
MHNKNEEPNYDEKIFLDDLKTRKNYFGREYVVGRPLPLTTRLAVIELFNTGAKSCEIAAKLNITHGCASKILKR